MSAGRTSLMKSPPGQLVEANSYYAFPLKFTPDAQHAARDGHNNLEYGCMQPGAPHVFIDDAKFNELWRGRRAATCWPTEVKKLVLKI